MRIGMMTMATTLLVVTAGMAHGERENRGLSPNSVSPNSVIAQAPQAGTPVKGRVIGSCQAIDYRPVLADGEGYWEESGGGLDPQSLAQLYFGYENRTDVQRPPVEAVQVFTQPQHGVVKLGTNNDSPQQYGYVNYIPNVNFIGKDKVTFRVTTLAGVVVVQYYLVVTNKGADGETGRRLCDKATKQPNSTSGWRISSSFTTPTLDKATLQALLDATGINDSVTVTTNNRE